MVSNYVKAQDETIYEDSESRFYEVRKLRESLVARRKYKRASAFMQLELTLANGLEMQASVGAAFGLCSVMEQTQDIPLLFRSARLGRQLSSILANVIPQMGQQAAQHSAKLMQQIFPQMEVQCPGMHFDIAVQLVRDSPSREIRKYQKYVDLSNVVKERGDFTRTNQVLLFALDAAETNWHQCKTLASGRAALQHLHDIHTAYIDFHQRDTGMAFFGSAGTAGYMTTLSEHYRRYHMVLRTFEDFQRRYADFEIPTQQERMFDLATRAAEKLALREKVQRCSKQHFKWRRQCPFSDQWGNLTESASSDPHQYLYQIFAGAEDPLEWGINALQLIVAWAQIEVKNGLLMTGAFRELFGFLQKNEQDDNSDSFHQYIEDLDSQKAACLYGDPEKPMPSVSFLDIMEPLKNWLNLPDRPPSQVARLNAAKIIMVSRLHRHRLYLTSKGLPDPTDISGYSQEQNLLDTIEKLEHNVGGGFGDQPERQRASRIYTTLTKCYVPETVKNQLVSDEELQSRISDCVDLVGKYANGGRRLFEYNSLLQQSRLQWQRYLLFRSVLPDSSLDSLERAELLFNDTRKQLLTADPADLFSATINLTEEFMSQEHTKMGVMASFKSLLENIASSNRAHAQGAPDMISDDPVYRSYKRFLKWTHRSKGRGLIDLLYFDVEVVQDLVETSSIDKNKPIASSVTSDLPSSVENLHIAENITLQHETEPAEPAKATVIPTVLSKDVTDDTIVSSAMISEMLSEVGDDVVLVDIINIPYLDKGGSQAILYRKAIPMLPIPLPDMTLQVVDRWVERYLGTQEKLIKMPLQGEDCARALQELTPLLMPLFNPKSTQSIRAKETIIFCLTGALHRIPVHAIPINGVPLIESQPVAYCQSLTTLYRSYRTVCTFPRSTQSVEGLAIVPSYEKRWMKEADAEEKLRQEIERVSKDVNVESCSGSDMTKQTLQDALSNCAHVLYFGHVHYDPLAPLRSALLQNERAYRNASQGKPNNEGLTVRDLFKIRLHRPALATIVGCGSGQALVSHSDDILGLSSALLFAGASAIVSTLWPIDPDDGANFAAAFYHAIRVQQKNLKTSERSADQQSGLENCVNLAYAMHETITILRQRGEGKKGAYHWSAFYLTGFWLFPPLTTK